VLWLVANQAGLDPAESCIRVMNMVSDWTQILLHESETPADGLPRGRTRAFITVYSGPRGPTGSRLPRCNPGEKEGGGPAIQAATIERLPAGEGQRISLPLFQVSAGPLAPPYVPSTIIASTRTCDYVLVALGVLAF